MFADRQEVIHLTREANRLRRCNRLRASIREAAKLHEQADRYATHRLGRPAYRKTFITLTYRPGVDWSRRHISDFLMHARKWLAARGCVLRYAWVAELQGRGALHYHVLVWVPRRLRLPRPDASGWWPHGMSNVETARSPVGYMVKYASKTRPEDLARLPKGVRLHGNGGHDPVSRTKLRETLAPFWIKQAMRERKDDRAIAAYEADQPMDTARRVRVLTPQPDGTVRERWDDPAGPPYGSPAYWDALLRDREAWQALEDQWARYADAYEAKGWPAYSRVKGGVCDLLTGEFIETPWRVVFPRGGMPYVERKETLQ